MSVQHLKPHQEELVEYAKKNIFDSNQKGLILYHGLGTGKTVTSIALCVTEMIHHKSFSDIHVIAPTTLKENFENTMKMINTMYDTNVKISFHNIGSRNLEKFIIPLKPKSYVIIDETHNLSNSIVNTSINRINTYMLLKLFDIRLYLLTATPIINDPYEIVPLINMIANKTVFPEKFADFQALIEKTPDRDFIRMMHKYISYHNLTADEGNMPRVLDTVVVDCMCDHIQALTYNTVYNKESSMTFRSTVTSGVYSMSKDFHSNKTHRMMTKSRIAANAVVIDGVVHSAKITKMIENIKKSSNKVLVYSEFIEYGTNLINNMLSEHGIKFCTINGSTPVEQRNNIIEKYNTDPTVRVMVITSSAAEGINLKNVREVHILEPYWNMSRIYQIIGRAVRYKSHESLAYEDRTVTPYIYLSYLSVPGDTVDSVVWEIAVSKQKRIDHMCDLLKSASIEHVIEDEVDESDGKVVEYDGLKIIV